jgi:hypothetical protein
MCAITERGEGLSALGTMAGAGKILMGHEEQLKINVMMLKGKLEDPEK